MKRPALAAAIAVLAVLAPARCTAVWAQTTVVDSFSEIPGAVFYDNWHSSPCGAHLHDPFPVDVGGGHVVTVSYYSELTGTSPLIGCANWSETAVSVHVANDPAVDPGDFIGEFQSFGTGFGDLIVNFSEPLTGFGSTSIIALSSNSYDPDRFIVYDAPNATGNAIGEATSDDIVGVQVRRDFKGVHVPTPQIRSVRYVTVGKGISIDGMALAVAGDPLDVPDPPVAGGAAGLSFGAATPNPFEYSTSFALALPATEHVRVEVFAVDGRRVRTLADREAGSGSLLLRWDGRDDRGARVPAGVYLVRGTTGSAMASRRIVLAR